MHSQDATACYGHGANDREWPAAHGWDRFVFDNLVAALGSMPVLGIARRFMVDLDKRFENATDRESLQRDSHAIASASGMLGFTALSQAAKALETICKSAGELGKPFAAVLVAREEAMSALSQLLDEAS